MVEIGVDVENIEVSAEPLIETTTVMGIGTVNIGLDEKEKQSKLCQQH
jgi:hypothetical protein